ncbi:ADP-ribosylglycohydrolase [Balamuthia mandrillaris]
MEPQGFSVVPKSDCPHLAAAFNKTKASTPVSEGGVAINEDLLAAGCNTCHVKGENWLCMQCLRVHCSRYVKGHAKTHYEANPDKHCVACSFADLSFWCYECDSYIVHESLEEVFAALHRAKFGTAPGEERMTLEQLGDVNTILQINTTGPEGASSSSSSSSSSSTGHWWVQGLEESCLESKLLDRILGCIYGNALGDAYGLATEFESKEQVTAKYKNAPVPFPNYKRTFHNMRWTAGDWTDDTDQLILIMDTLLETQGSVDENIFARKLKHWVNHGFTELGDFAGMGLGFTVSSVLQHPDFLLAPHAASKATWIKLNREAAPNGAVMRTAVLGVYQFEQLEKVIENTIRMAKVTHWDPRCIASSVATTVAIALMLQEKHDVESFEGLQKLIGEAMEHSTKFLKKEEHKKEFEEHIKRDSTLHSLHSLQLSESQKIGYTFKCVGSGFWALCSDRDFKETFNLLIKEGGDADTNGAVAGALFGTRKGYSALPKEWLSAMPHKAWLDEKVVRFLRLLGLVDEHGRAACCASSSSSSTEPQKEEAK